MSVAEVKFNPSEYVTPFGKARVSKVARYGWILRDRPGVYMLINKHEIFIDHSYQRENVILSKVREIQSNWSWAGCGCLLVAMRNDGSLWVFDGQHRLLAAKQRDDIEKLPCLVFEVADVKQEAAGFLVTNSERKPVTAVAKFKALVLTGDVNAVAVQEIFDDLDITMTEQPKRSGEIKCVGLCLQIATQDKVCLEKALRACVIVCTSEPIPKDVLHGMVWIHKKYGLLDDSKFMNRLSSLSCGEIMGNIARFAAAEGKRGERVCGKAVMRLVNKGLRSKFGDSDDYS